MWQGHTNCNKFAKEEGSEVKDARTELMRYAHFFERYKEHEKAQQFADGQMRETLGELAKLLAVEGGISEKAAQFLTLGVDEVVASRRFLKWTYAHGFILDLPPDRRKLFEFHQAQFEGTLERLSDLMENTPWSSYVDGTASGEPRSQGASLSSVVQDQRRSLSQAMMAQGEDKD